MENYISTTKYFLEKYHFKLGKMPNNLNSTGEYYIFNKNYGKGSYWVYEKPEMFALGILDINLDKDLIVEFNQPDFISISHYDTISGEELNPYKRINANNIRGHISDNKIFRAHFHKSVPVKGLELILYPKFYKKFLKEKFGNEYINTKYAFQSIDGINYYPDLLLILHQIQSYKGTGKTAEIYYESKVIEAISIIFDKSKNMGKFKQDNYISKEDLNNLEAVNSYISDHFAFNIKTEDLAKIACMGQTKLRTKYKSLYGITITECIHNKRIAQAEFMLINTDLQIIQIANSIGYKSASKFSELFKKNTGLLPNEYRKTMQKS